MPELDGPVVPAVRMSTQVTRFDVAPSRLGKFTRTGSGGVRVPATISRTGCQRYGERVEYRPEAEVFSADSLATLPAAAVTRGHPAEPVTAANWKTLSVGHVAETPAARKRIDQHDWIETAVVISDADTQAAVERGDVVEVSAGYTCELDPTPGVAPDGTRYDAIQRNIRFNHLAVLGQGEKARAGAEAKLRLDRNDMVKIVIDGVEYDKGSDAHIAAIAAGKDKQIAAEKARADKAEAERDLAKKDADEAKAAAAPERLDAAVTARLKLRADAARLLPTEYKFEGKSDAQVRVDAVTAAKVDVAGKSADYVAAYFDALLAKAPAAPAQYVGEVPGTRADAAPYKPETDAEFQARLRRDSLGQQPLAAKETK